MEVAVEVIQTLGFPIACVVALGFFIWKFVSKIQEENNRREDKLMTIIQEYGEKM